MEPAASIIRKFGGDSALGAIIGLDRAAVWKWRQPRAAPCRGGDGVIPQRHIPALLDAARARDIALTAADFLPVKAPPKSKRRRAA
jgi:hypothetical protein